LSRPQSDAKNRIGRSHQLRQLVSEPALFKETHPILGTLDIQRAIEFYTQRISGSVDRVCEPRAEIDSVERRAPRR
jgi:hypothetical protein